MLIEAEELWFDVERRYKTIIFGGGSPVNGLWFDVERRYKTMKNNTKEWIQ